MKIALACGLVASMALSATSVAAQNRVCGDRDRIVAELAAKYGEYRQSAGLRNDSVMVEVFASETGSWTILFTRPNGISCFAAAGQAWRNQGTVKTSEPGFIL